MSAVHVDQANTPAVGSGLVLRFTEWECGHHQHRPAPIAVNDVGQAFAILHALSHAISQRGHLRAQVYGSAEFGGDWGGVYVTDDHVSPDGVAAGTHWPARPVVIHGPAELLDEIAGEALKEAREDHFWRLADLAAGWLGTTPLEAGALVTTPLSLEQLAALDESIFPCPTLFEPAAEVLTRLRDTAAEFARLDALDEPPDSAATAAAPRQDTEGGAA